MNQVAFKDCGRVNFANTGHGEGVVQGIHTGRGMTKVDPSVKTDFIRV